MTLVKLCQLGGSSYSRTDRSVASVHLQGLRSEGCPYLYRSIIKSVSPGMKDVVRGWGLVFGERGGEGEGGRV